MSSPDAKPARSAFVFAFAAIYIIWGSTYLGIRVAVESMPPFAMAAVRFFIAGGLMLAALRLRGYAMPTRKQWRDSAIIGTCLLLGGNGLVAWAELLIPSGIAALIIGVQPLFMVTTEWAWPGGQRPAPAVFVGMALGLVGLGLLSSQQDHGTSTVHLAGVAAILVACGSWAFGSIFSRHAKPAPPPLVGAAAQMLCGSVSLAIAAGFRGEFSNLHLSSIHARSWWALAYLIAIGSWVGYSTFVWLMKHSTPARVSTYAYVNPIVAVFLGWLILDEPLTPRTLLSAAIIVAAVVIVTTQKNRKPRTAVAAPSGDLSPVSVRRS